MPTPPAPPAPLHAAGALARAGEIGAALAELDRLHRADATAADPVAQAVLLATELDCRLARGQLQEAAILGARLDDHLGAAGLVGAFAHHGRGELAAAVGGPELALDHFDATGRLLAGLDADDSAHVERLPWRIGAALALVRSGRHHAGVDLVHEHLDRAAGTAYGTALGLRARATVDARADHQALLREALHLLTTVPAARLVAQIETDLAGLLLLRPGTDHHHEALALLRHAEEYAEREQLRPLLGRIQRLLLRLGAAAHPAAPMATHAVLTAAERRVAGLAASGHSNRQIADELIVSVKAVEWHLSHVYRKLGIRTRAALPGALGATLSLG